MHYIFLCLKFEENRGNLFSEVQQGVEGRPDDYVVGEGVFAQSALVGYRL